MRDWFVKIENGLAPTLPRVNGRELSKWGVQMVIGNKTRRIDLLDLLLVLHRHMRHLAFLCITIEALIRHLLFSSS